MSTVSPIRSSPPAPDSATTASDLIAHPRPWLAAWTLCRREWVRFIRQRNRVFGALGQPLIFWILLSALLDPSFRLGSVSYAAYFFPGTLVLIVLFTAIFTTISIIEDRREGFLQSVLVSPAPRWAIVAGKVLGGALIALAHAAVFLLLGFTLEVSLTLLTLPLAIVHLFVVGLALTSLGLAIAWRMQSTQGYHAIMMSFLLPMWLLSGAFAPKGSNWLAWLISINPLTYCVGMLRHILYLGAEPGVREAALSGVPAAWICALVTLGFVGLTFVLAWRVAAVRTAGDATT